MDSAKKEIVTAMSIVMRAEIFSYGEGLLKGELFSQYLDQPFEFTNLLRMIDKMEEIFDEKKFPHSFLSPRTFGSDKRGGSNAKEERSDAMKEGKEQIVIEDMSGAKCTFEITVRFRQNATWQGQIVWVEKNQKQNFRSVLEMLKLMDEALTEGASDIKQLAWK